MLTFSSEKCCDYHFFLLKKTSHKMTNGPRNLCPSQGKSQEIFVQIFGGNHDPLYGQICDNVFQKMTLIDISWYKLSIITIQFSHTYRYLDAIVSVMSQY